MREPNQQQRLFYKYYVLNGAHKGAGSKSAREANYSSKNAGAIASQLLKRTDAQKWIDIEIQALADKVEMETTEIIRRYQDMARKQGDYSNATVTESERALKQLGKYKNMQGFAEKVIIEQQVPFDGLSLEELRELKKYIQEKGRLPKGTRLPDIRTAIGYISERLSEKSGTGNN